MASVYNQLADQRYYLKAHTTLGRLGSSVDILIERPEVSKIHALIEWDQDQWCIKDLSCNGIWLNQEKVARNVATPIKLGDTIHLASKTGYALHIENISAPRDMLMPSHDNPEQAIVLDTYNLLPNEKKPIAALTYCSQLKIWELEFIDDDNPGKCPIEDNQVFSIGEQQWRLQMNAEVETTAQLPTQEDSVANVHFHFDVSQDEETTKLKLQIQEHTVNLKSRSHHYLALLLARKRRYDQQHGLSEPKQGWVYSNQLGRDLGIDSCHVNILIHRLRKQVSDNLPQLKDLENLIERQVGELRLGSRYIQIVKGGELEV